MNTLQRLLLVINSILLLGFIGIVLLFAYSPEAFINITQEGPSEEFMEEYEVIKDYVLEQMEAEEFIRDEEALEDTLTNVETLKGYVDLRGYMVTERRELFGQEHELSYFAFSEASDETIIPALDFLIDSGSTVNRKNSGTYYLSLGCERNDGIENPIFNIYTDTYSDLKKSSADNKITVRAFFGSNGDNGGMGGPCLSNASGLQVL